MLRRLSHDGVGGDGVNDYWADERFGKTVRYFRTRKVCNKDVERTENACARTDGVRVQLPLSLQRLS